MRSVTAHWLGRIGYERAHELQEKLVERRVKGEIGDTLLLLEHDPVVTIGKGGDLAHLLGGVAGSAEGGTAQTKAAALRARGIAFAETGRGGDVTYHGPGQLVAYPIFDLRPDRCDVRRYVRDLASVMVALCNDFGVSAGIIPGDSRYVGVWVDRDAPRAWTEINSDDARFPGRRLAKIGAIGVRLSRWCTMHGFAFNVRPNLGHFSLIVPCGIQEYGVTSLEELEADAPAIETVAGRAADHFAKVFGAETRLTTSRTPST